MLGLSGFELFSLGAPGIYYVLNIKTRSPFSILFL